MSSGPVVVVGSGASGVHFALSLLERGHRVRLLDVGIEGPTPTRPDDDLNKLKALLPDPAGYFLGDGFESLILPGHRSEYYGFPPSQEYVFEGVDGVPHEATGFTPLFSFAAGGLAQAWTGGCYPFDDAELGPFPFGLAELAPYYGQVAARIGICGASDDLARFFPVHDGLLPPLELDRHSRTLLEVYERKKARLNRKLRCYMGRARLAVLSEARDGRPSCSYLGRCLWGCPTKAFYTPSLTLDRCREMDGFEYVRGVRVTHFEYGDGGVVTRVIAQSVPDGAKREFDVGSLALAAGTLGTSRILLESLHRGSGERPELPGLMDNRQALMPFVNLRMIGRPFEPASYQYHQVAIGVEGDHPDEYVHGLVTTLKTALIHPLVQTIPTSVGIASGAFRNVHAALGLVNVNFSDTRRDGNRVALEDREDGGPRRLRIAYRPPENEGARFRRAVRTLRRFLRALGCVAPPGMTRMRPMGASVHYAGTVPMTPGGGDLTSDELGRCRPFENLYLVDGTTFPSLPAKNLTFTLMANAVRIADRAF